MEHRVLRPLVKLGVPGVALGVLIVLLERLNFNLTSLPPTATVCLVFGVLGVLGLCVHYWAPHRIPSGGLLDHSALERQGIIGAFNSFFFNDLDWRPLFQSSRNVKLLFMYGRHWRESNNDNISNFLKNRGRLTVVLPDYRDGKLLSALCLHHEASRTELAEKIRRADEFYQSLSQQFRGQVSVIYIHRMPTIAIYLFDSEAIFTLAPNCLGRRPVPTFRVSRDGEIYKYLLDDFSRIENGACGEREQTPTPLTGSGISGQHPG